MSYSSKTYNDGTFRPLFLGSIHTCSSLLTLVAVTAATVFGAAEFPVITKVCSILFDQYVRVYEKNNVCSHVHI